MKSNTNIKEGYKKTAVGVIPEEWKKVKLRDIAERVTRRNKELNDTVITISAQRGLILQEDYFTKRVASDTLSNYYLLHRGEFAYNKSYSNGYPMGAFKRLDDFEKAVVTTLYICFKIKDNIDTDFLLNYFEAGLLVRNLMKIAQEGGRAHGLLNIGIEDFFNLKLSIPSLPEQQAIANCLTTWDRGIETLTALIETKREQKKGLMQQLLTGKKRLDGFTGEWKKTEIKECLKYEQPSKYLTNEFNEINNDNKTPVLTANKSFILGYTDESEGIYKDLPVIIFDDFTTASRYINFPFKIKSSAIKLLKAKMNFNLKFLFERLQLINHDISTHKRRWISEFQDMVLPIPSLIEQNAIADFSHTIDQEISLLEKKLEAMKEEKKGLMQVLLTGEKRLIDN